MDYALLAARALPAPLLAAVNVTLHSRSYDATLAVTPTGNQAGKDAPLRGDHYSPLEARIVAVVAASGKRLYGKEIARELGMKYDRQIKGILGNLVLRRALTNDSQGYGLGPTA